METECIQGLKFPDGDSSGETRGAPGSTPVRLRNARVARSLELSGMRVLDVGCGPGLYSLYMADSAKEVVGIDHNPRRITKAEATRHKLGYSNVQFKVVDIRDLERLQELGAFDLVVAWGFLHRISDLISTLYSLASITNALSFEWATPVFPRMRRASLAYHRTDVDALDITNLVPVGKLSAEEMIGKRIGGESGFWFPTPFAVESIMRKFGYGSARILGYNEHLVSQRRLLLWHLSRAVARPSKVTYARVHMIVERTPGLISFKYKDFRNAQVPEWDVAGRTYLDRQ
jgi:2-polyprenyl-3-methyl-5-hydroxy-6-metoxy-1,4-benzoquinol methylase